MNEVFTTASWQTCRLTLHTQHGGGVTHDHVYEVCSTIGNVVRIAMAIELDEVRAACEIAAKDRLESMMLDPHLDPLSVFHDRQNQHVLEAFMQFRIQLQIARAGFEFDETKPG